MKERADKEKNQAKKKIRVNSGGESHDLWLLFPHQLRVSFSFSSDQSLLQRRFRITNITFFVFICSL